MNGHPSTCSCVYCNHSGANNGMYGRKHSVAALEKMRNRIFSEQTRKKMSESQKKKTVNPLAGLKISAALKGRPHSVEHNNKVRAALAGKPKSAEHKEKLRLSALKRTVKFFDTAIELKIESVLVLMGVKYVK